MSQSLKYGGIHYSHFEYIQTPVTSLFMADFVNNYIKINDILSTLLQDILTAYIAFPFKLSIDLYFFDMPLVTPVRLLSESSNIKRAGVKLLS